MHRALELFDLTLDDPRLRNLPGRLREVARAREVVADFFAGPNQDGSTAASLEKASTPTPWRCAWRSTGEPDVRSERARARAEQSESRGRGRMQTRIVAENVAEAERVGLSRRRLRSLSMRRCLARGRAPDDERPRGSVVISIKARAAVPAAAETSRSAAPREGSASRDVWPGR